MTVTCSSSSSTYIYFHCHMIVTCSSSSSTYIYFHCHMTVTCSSLKMWWTKNCCRFSLQKLMHSCSKLLISNVSKPKMSSTPIGRRFWRRSSCGGWGGGECAWASEYYRTSMETKQESFLCASLPNSTPGPLASWRVTRPICQSLQYVSRNSVPHTEIWHYDIDFTPLYAEFHFSQNTLSPLTAHSYTHPTTI